MNLPTLVQDKSFLKNTMDSDFNFPHNGISAAQLAFSLMPNLKSTDAVLRDELSFSILEKIIMEGLLSSIEVDELLDLAMSDDYLFSGIGEVNTDSVFTRSFAILVVAAGVEVDTEQQMFSSDRIHQITSVVLDYANREQDGRGFVEGKGWAHSVAHTADALDSCSHHPALSEEDRKAILDAIAHLVIRSASLAHNEDDRLAFPVFRMIQSENFSYHTLREWLSKFDIENTSSHESLIQLTNVQHFLRSLYFLVYWELGEHPFLADMSSQLKKLSIYYRYGVLPLSAT
ncbi:DUF2785 domain-containing protein [Alicyclobacillus sp. SO9]|uniref:DUF2785 domain-containing protein n=1 Tax=Alicyclobacillus sp. SO9 TaxID=2665646 RepID=UPI0018E7C6D1|nr:DUF2785 domain-containing protein [Alicyclobacillus sp. SO9]QQE78578.1 DUF2785 domain-containing protein [Alicyclobacillus sp. SO9]